MSVAAGTIAIPTDPYAPFAPSDAEPWNVARAAHLARRAGFGASDDSLKALLQLTPQQAVDSFVDFDPDSDSMDTLHDQIQGLMKIRGIESAQDWWLYRIINTVCPLREKMTLFWHNRFATSAIKVQQAELMEQQIDLFRQMGLGNFRDLVVAVGHDAAMLQWLDGATNRKGAPNENYAREMMELFTLGIGSYTEQDVKELARAFTGWSIQQQHGEFDKAKGFDPGVKTIFGQKGPFDSETAVDVVLAQPAAPKHLAQRMLRDFVHPEPADDQIAYYAARLLAEKWEIKPVLREMLGSRLFFSEWAYRSKIKSPVELVAAAVKVIGGKANMPFLRNQLEKMGQTLLMPPNVKGWDGDEAWINANTVLLRFNLGLSLSQQRGDSFAKRTDLDSWLHKHDLKTADDMVDHFSRALLDGNLTPASRAELLDYMNHGTKNQPKPFVLTTETMNVKVRGIIHLMMAMPEYQLL